MSYEQRNIIWKSYMSLKRCQSIGNLLGFICVGVAIVVAFYNHPNTAVFSGILAALNFFHAAHCRFQAKELRNEMSLSFRQPEEQREA